MHYQLFQIAYFGNGGFDIESLYQMPLWRIMLYYNYLLDEKEKEKEEYEKITKNQTTTQKKYHIPEHIKNKYLKK